MRLAVVLSTMIAGISAHGFIRSIRGANGVIMPGLTVNDGTPRNCAVNACGAQADTAIIRDEDISSAKAPPLGRTEGAGPVDPALVINSFMSPGKAPAKNPGDCEKDVETIVADLTGQGPIYGFPTSDDQGVVTLLWRQVDQDGAGPVTASIDPSSGGSDAKAFQSAQVKLNVPGSSSLSTNVKSSFLIRVQMPKGMVCSGVVGGVNNVCIVRVRNGAIAGPFGGAAAFTQSVAARKRALK